MCCIAPPLPHAAGRSLGLRVAAQQTTQESSKADASSADSAARQMLGMKGAALETNIWKIRVQLTKPITWVPLIWGEGGRGRREWWDKGAARCCTFAHIGMEATQQLHTLHTLL